MIFSFTSSMLLNLLVLSTLCTLLAHGAAVPVGKEDGESISSKFDNITNASPPCICTQAPGSSPRVTWRVGPGVYAYTTNFTNNTVTHWSSIMDQRPRGGSCTNPLTSSVVFGPTFSSRLRKSLTYWEYQAVMFSLTCTTSAILLAVYALVLAVYRCIGYRQKGNTICEEVVDTDNIEHAQEKISVDDGDDTKDSGETDDGQEMINNQGDEPIASVDEYLNYVGVVKEPVPAQTKLGKLAAEYKRHATEN